MRGIESISRSLSDLVDSLPPGELTRVICCALELVARDYAGEPLIQDAVRQYPYGIPRPELALRLERESQDHDREYLRLEEIGEMEKSDYHFRVMCTCNGLSALFRGSELSLRLVDDVIYDLGFGAANIDDYGAELEKTLRS